MLGHTLLGTSATMAMLCSNVLGGTFVLPIGAQRHTAELWLLAPVLDTLKPHVALLAVSAGASECGSCGHRCSHGHDDASQVGCGGTFSRLPAQCTNASGFVIMASSAMLANSTLAVLFARVRCEHRMMSQDGTGEGECHQSLSKGPPISHSTVPQYDVTKGGHTGKRTHDVLPLTGCGAVLTRRDQGSAHRQIHT